MFQKKKNRKIEKSQKKKKNWETFFLYSMKSGICKYQTLTR